MIGFIGLLVVMLLLLGPCIYILLDVEPARRRRAAERKRKAEEYAYVAN